MKHFTAIFARRKIASTMVAIWLFGLASGLANACLLETPQPHARGTPLEASAVVHEDQHPSKAPCVKACDDSSQALQKLSAGVDPGHSGSASLVAILWSTSPPGAPTPRRSVDHRPSLSDPPLRVLYSRWTS